MKQTTKNANIAVRNIIKERCLTRTEVAKALGVHPSTVSHKMEKEMPKYEQKEIIKILRKVRHDFTKGAK